MWSIEGALIDRQFSKRSHRRKRNRANWCIFFYSPRIYFLAWMLIIDCSFLRDELWIKRLRLLSMVSPRRRSKNNLRSAGMCYIFFYVVLFILCWLHGIYLCLCFSLIDFIKVSSTTLYRTLKIDPWILALAFFQSQINLAVHSESSAFGFVQRRH